MAENRDNMRIWWSLWSQWTAYVPHTIVWFIIDGRLNGWEDGWLSTAGATDCTS
jgi:hypothetical protein